MSPGRTPARSRRQTGARDTYDTYLASPTWHRRRVAWAQHERELHGPTILCAVCGQPWDEAIDDLHHIDYQRLGAELHADLKPLHRTCHDAIHTLLELPAYRRISKRHANLTALAALRRRYS